MQAITLELTHPSNLHTASLRAIYKYGQLMSFMRGPARGRQVVCTWSSRLKTGLLTGCSSSSSWYYEPILCVRAHVFCLTTLVAAKVH
jgi:hypothetical protein